MIKLKVSKFKSIASKHKGKIVYQAMQSRVHTASFEALLQDVVTTTALSRADAISAITIFTEQAENYLSQGYRVDLGELGTLAPKVACRQCLNPDDANRSSVKDIGITYRPRKKTLERIRQAELKFDNPHKTKRTRASKPSELPD